MANFVQNYNGGVQFKTGASQGLTVDINGNIGIGTSNTSACRLNTYGKGTTGNVWGDNLVQFVDSTPNETGLRIAVNATTSGLTQLVASTNSAASQFGFWTYNGSSWGERMRIDANGNLLLTSGTGALGYGTGAGGTVTQLTSKSTAVTLNKPSGVIFSSNSALAAGASAVFIFTNSLIKLYDNVIVSGNDAIYRVESSATGNGYCSIRISNISGSSLSQIVEIAFQVVKGAQA